MGFSRRGLLARMRIAIPFLRQIPDDIYFTLDTSEFFFPTLVVAKVRAELEEALHKNITTYKSDVFNLLVPVERHLCSNIKPARLTKEQFTFLYEKEQLLRELGINVSFSAYEQPIELIDPRSSTLNTYYKARGLV